ncbi:MAG: hypothetical protein KatS3mg105_0106 [Gemmatales bacterium]|nr:MAG: hypothetical protein KatS3mg105_0106 [Gemmatales bacterium]
MDVRTEFLEQVREQGVAEGHFLGLLHVLIGRRIEKADGSLVANGLTWRELASLLKKVRWDRNAVRELNLDPDALPPRDRERYWYTAISQAGVDSPEAVAAGDELARRLQPLGYVVGPAPGQTKSSSVHS